MANAHETPDWWGAHTGGTRLDAEDAVIFLTEVNGDDVEEGLGARLESDYTQNKCEFRGFALGLGQPVALVPMSPGSAQGECRVLIYQ